MLYCNKCEYMNMIRETFWGAFRLNRIYSLPDTGSAFSLWVFPQCRYETEAGRQTCIPRYPWWSRRLQRSSCGPDQRGRSAFRDPEKYLIISLPQTLNSLSYLVDEVFEEVGLVSEGVVNQPIAEGDNAVRKVMLREPGHHALLLHVRTAGYIHYQIPQVLPVPANDYND